MTIPPQVFPVCLMILNLCASAIYAVHGDYRRMIYWIAAAVLTACVTL